MTGEINNVINCFDSNLRSRTADTDRLAQGCNWITLKKQKCTILRLPGMFQEAKLTVNCTRRDNGKVHVRSFIQNRSCIGHAGAIESNRHWSASKSVDVSSPIQVECVLNSSSVHLERRCREEKFNKDPDPWIFIIFLLLYYTRRRWRQGISSSPLQRRRKKNEMCHKLFS